MNNELMHYGTLGMKWGVRRYQNSDGSLTAAGRKRYGTKANFEKVQRAKKAATVNKKAAKAREKANARTEAEVAKYKKKAGIKDKPEDTTETKPKTKSISEMSDDELRAKISRIQLENQLNSLTPKSVSKGQKFVKFAKDYILPAVKDPLTKYVQQELSKQLGINTEDAKKASEKLAQEAKDSTNRKIIENNKRWFEQMKQQDEAAKKAEKEAKKADNNSRQASNDEDTIFTGTVSGEGTSKGSQIRKEESKSKPSGYYDPINVDFEDVSESTVSSGRDYVSQFLGIPEPKKK